MSRSSKKRRRASRRFYPEDIAEHPPQRRAAAEIDRVASILDNLPVRSGQLERSGAK